MLKKKRLLKRNKLKKHGNRGLFICCPINDYIFKNLHQKAVQATGQAACFSTSLCGEHLINSKNLFEMFNKFPLSLLAN